MGAVVILIGGDCGLPSVLNLIGLLVLPVILIFPAFIDTSTQANVKKSGRIWVILLVVSLIFLAVGTLLGFSYNFPKLPLGIGAFILIVGDSLQKASFFLDATIMER